MRRLKIAIAAIAILIIAAIVAWSWVSNHYEGVIKQKLPEWVAEATDSLYRVSIEDVSLNLVTRDVTLTNTKLWPDKKRFNQLKTENTLPKTVFSLSARTIEIEKIKLAALLAGKKLSCKKLSIHMPNFVITALPVDSVIKVREEKDPAIDAISVAQIEIVGPQITYLNAKNVDSQAVTFHGGLIVLSDWLFDPKQPINKERLLYAKAATVMFDSMTYHKHNSIYRFRAGAINFSTDSRSVTIKDIRFRPLVSREDFYRRVRYQRDIYYCRFPSVKLEGFDWQKAINDQEVKASGIFLTDPRMRIYHSRALPVEPDKIAEAYPHQRLLQFNFPVFIDSIHLENGAFRYTELNAKSMREGYFNIDRMNGSVRNITNIAERIAKDSTLVIDLSGRFMRESEVEARFELNLTDTTGRFVVNGVQTKLTALQIGRISKALALAEIIDGDASKIDYHIEGDQTGATGRVKILYKDLKIKVQEVDEQGQLRGQFRVSLFLNQELIHNSNPLPGEPVRISTVYFKKPQDRGFFTVLWKSSLNSVIKTVAKDDTIVGLLK